MADDREPTATGSYLPRTDGPADRAMERARYVAAVPAVAFVLLAVVVMVWGTVKGVTTTVDLVEGGRKDATYIADFLKVADLFLIGMVFLIVGIGFWELFVSDLELPGWLVIDSLGSLKNKLIDTLLLILGVSFVERTLAGTPPDELLELGAATALGGGVLVAFRALVRSK